LDRALGYDYEVEGNYISLGPDLNIFGYSSVLDQFTVGFRYERAWYNQRAQLSAPSRNIWQNIDEDRGIDYQFLEATDSDAVADWFSVEARAMAEIFRYVYLATSVKLQFNLDPNENLNIRPAIIPGYGYVRSAVSPGFNVSLFIRIPVNYTVPRRKRYLPALY
jgi:hypothetical protein